MVQRLDSVEIVHRTVGLRCTEDALALLFHGRTVKAEGGKYGGRVEAKQNFVC